MAWIARRSFRVAFSVRTLIATVDCAPQQAASGDAAVVSAVWIRRPMQRGGTSNALDRARQRYWRELPLVSRGGLKLACRDLQEPSRPKIGTLFSVIES